jgi:hypothetical protein
MSTSTERSKALRARRKKGRIILKVEVDAADLREIALAGYTDAVSTDRNAQGKAVTLFLSDTVNG